MAELRALVWRRQDFWESSRLVTLLTREEGKIHTLAKGAHRPSSVFMGRLDLLNTVTAVLHGRPGTGLRLLSAVKLLHEPRALRQPARFALASYLVELFDHAFLDGRADATLFDLLCGGLTLVERAPLVGLGPILVGLELRFLEAIGCLPGLTGCSVCQAPGPLIVEPHGRGLLCPQHAPPGARHVQPAVLRRLHELATTPGARWATLPLATDDPAVLEVLFNWLTAAIERRLRWRGQAVEQINAARRRAERAPSAASS